MSERIALWYLIHIGIGLLISLYIWGLTPWLDEEPMTAKVAILSTIPLVWLPGLAMATALFVVFEGGMWIGEKLPWSATLAEIVSSLLLLLALVALIISLFAIVLGVVPSG